VVVGVTPVALFVVAIGAVLIAAAVLVVLAWGPVALMRR
jgi:hypothetical protein